MEGVVGLMELQKILLPVPTIPPIMPLHHVSALPTLLNTLIKPSAPPTIPSDPTTALSLLPLTTTSTKPMSQHTVNILTDLFPDLRGLVRGLDSAENREVVGEYVGAEAVAGMVEFWGREWVRE
ncbi:MAG: hypothetical protein M1817_005115 [Caeruleum heppii]|nr:MAG: hypothetical protein M1817_005115 [Caeruleum heppii]